MKDNDNTYIEKETDLGRIRGLERETDHAFLGIRYARAERFCYAAPVENWEGTYDATHFGDACTQYRTYFPHLDVPERRFYHREFREGLSFTYSEDCLNLNIYAPKEAKQAPVLVFIHGGGFNSMANSEGYLDGAGYTKRGILLVTINYRVGVFGYLTHEEIQEKNGRDGNFGLDDQLVALKWIKQHIASFGGDPENITVMGQSAGAISLQYLCLSKKAEGLFKRAIMLSGGGLFPKIARPKPAAKTRDYWKAVMEKAGAKTLEEFRQMNEKDVLAAIETVKTERKDNTVNTQPVVDGYLLETDTAKLIGHPLQLDYMAGTTSNDMFNAVLYHMAWKFIRKNKGYRYFFDIDAPGDDNGAFHSSDLRYFFGTLEQSFRPYDEKDKAVSEQMMDYVAAFVRTGDPNQAVTCETEIDGYLENEEGKSKEGILETERKQDGRHVEKRAVWTKSGKPLYITREGFQMNRPSLIRLIQNTFRGDPK